jgi:S1-C subfamily serine protease
VTTTGRVTALNRTISVQDDNGEVAQLKNLIQTSAKLVPGDSGGPLLDATGRVIGIDAAGSPTFSFQGTAPGYAIPSNRASGIAAQIDAKRPSATVHIGDTAFIGLTVAQTAEGLTVGTIVPGSPAANAGLQAGDLLTALDGSQISSFDDVRRLLFAHHPGDSVTLQYTGAGGTDASATIVLASGPPQ